MGGLVVGSLEGVGSSDGAIVAVTVAVVVVVVVDAAAAAVVGVNTEDEGISTTEVLFGNTALIAGVVLLMIKDEEETM